jgi:hypothetical protein
MVTLRPLRTMATSGQAWRTLAIGIVVGALSLPLFLR